MIILVIFFLINGCSKKELNLPLVEDTKNQQEVINQFLKIPENASDELRYLIGDIKKTEGQYHFLYEFIQRNGMPDWVSSESNLQLLNGSSTKAGSITSNSVVISSNSLTSGGTYFIPLIDTNSKEVKSYIFCSKLSNGKIKYKTYNKQAILSSTAKDSNDVKLKGVMLSVFAHFERKINKKIVSHSHSRIISI